MKKKIYMALSADVLHHGHINLINKAQKYGDIIFGLLTDKAISERKKVPYLTFEQRKKIIQNIKGIDTIVPQHEWDYSFNILKYKPDYFIHGDDWFHNSDNWLRKNVIIALNSYGGKLIEIEHTKNISSNKIRDDYLKRFSHYPDIRKSSLKRAIESGKFIRLIEVNTPFTAIMVEKTYVTKKKKNYFFDGFWSSSLCDSIIMGRPDNESLDLSKRFSNINSIFDVSSLPLVMDFDTGGKIEHFIINLKTAERIGISAIVIEDKIGLKKNSLLGNSVKQEQDSIENFCKKISKGKENKQSEDFMIIARIESLILDKGIKDALKRAEAYSKAGADSILIHSRKESANEIIEFAKKFRKINPYIPLVAVPTTFNSIKDSDLNKAGFNIVIYANHLIRGMYPAIEYVLRKILKDERSVNLKNNIVSIKKILDLIPGTN
jgi:phosphoenolpyruvate phosphomutase